MLEENFSTLSFYLKRNKLIVLILKIERLFRNMLNLIKGKLACYIHKVDIGENSKIIGKPFIINRGKIIIRENVTVNSSYYNNPIGGQTFTTFWTRKKGCIEIGSNCKISNSTFVSENSIKIDSNVYIGGDCRIYDTDFHSINYSNRIKTIDDDIKTAPIIINSNVFVGANVTILKGVIIGRNSVIGAGSILTHSVPENEIWAGNPAKFIKKIEC